MQKLFTKILVPVNFNRNTGLVLDKAIQIANHFECDIHLLHVQTAYATIPFLYDGFFAGSFIKSSNDKCVANLKKIEYRLKGKLKTGLSMTSAVIMGSWQAVLKQVTISEHIDLLIIPKNRRRFDNALIQRVDLNWLSLHTQCPVLTVTRSFRVNHLEKIVVPINDTIPIRKLSLATYLCRESNGSIHLMGGGGNTKEGREKRKFLIKAYQLLKDFGNIKIQCSLPDDYDNPESTLAYARSIHADLIVVNTGRESLLKGWWNKLLGKCLYRQSDIPVLTIAPGEERYQLNLN